MDTNVIAAMARWPDVPDVFGWLSLSERGAWRLHPRGDALQDATDAGEAISSPQILQFIGRNYAGDEQGRWFFQNGPQRVFVRLDAAPYILQTLGAPPALQTHNGLSLAAIRAWWLDDSGRLYAQTEYGPGLVAGRDLSTVLDALRTADNRPLAEILEQSNRAQTITVQPWPLPAAEAKIAAISADCGVAGEYPIALNFCAAQDIPGQLGFQRYPAPAQIR
ncbi:DUF2946 family protein [Paralcaligenes ginsengisoli]